jgi:hypothetical protein
MTASGSDRNLTALEVATGIVYGTVRGAPRPAPPPAGPPLAALEHVCLPALRRPPCLISFSGGRDSSLVLAVATHVARREGLPLPIPATNRFPDVDHTDESRWQELLVRHLGLDEWHRLSFTDELEAVGPVARRVLRRHGLLWPFNAHFHAPLLEAASGGSLLTGIGGDEVFGESRWARAKAVITGRARPRPRDLPRVGLLASPTALRRAVLTRRPPVEFPWLRPDAQREFARLWAADQASEPVRFGPRLRRLQSLRALRVGLRSLDLLAADTGTTIAHPLATAEFGAAVAAVGGWHGFEDRTLAMRTLFGELLPETLLSRSTKARFEGAFWSDHSRALAASWNGAGADLSLVDPDALRAVWSQRQPDGHSCLLLQAAWLAGPRSDQLDHRPVAGSRQGP